MNINLYKKRKHKKDMANKRGAINHKVAGEINKSVWILKDKEGNILDTFRQKETARKEKKRIEKLYLGEMLILERDDTYKLKLKKNLK